MASNKRKRVTSGKFASQGSKGSASPNTSALKSEHKPKPRPMFAQTGPSRQDTEDAGIDELSVAETLAGMKGVVNSSGSKKWTSILDDELEESDSMESGQEDEPTSDAEVFQMLFDVPCGNAACELEVSSDEAWTNFVADICEVMGRRVSALRIGYIFSFLPKSPKPLPKLLNDEKTWKTLIKNASSWLETERQKKKGKGIAKQWSIRIVDLTETPKDASKGSKTLEKKKKKKSTGPALSNSPDSIGETHSKPHQIIEQLQAAHHCNGHGKACVVLSNGVHHALTIGELTIWADQVVEGAAKIAQPPDCLELNAKAQLKRMKTAAAPPPPPLMASAPSNDLTDVLKMLLPYALQNTSTKIVPESHIPTPATPERRSISLLSGSSSGYKRTLDSSPLQLAASSLIDYPTLTDWLTQLDVDPMRGRDAQNYVQYAPLLHMHGLLRLDDISSMSSAGLMDVCAGLSLGSAGRLVRWAGEDMAILQSKARKKMRHS